MIAKLNWRPHSCGGLVCDLPDGGIAHIVPKAFGGDSTRLRVHGNTHSGFFFHHQVYKSVKEAKAALVLRLSSCAGQVSP